MTKRDVEPLDANSCGSKCGRPGQVDDGCFRFELRNLDVAGIKVTEPALNRFHDCLLRGPSGRQPFRAPARRRDLSVCEASRQECIARRQEFAELLNLYKVQPDTRDQ